MVHRKIVEMGDLLMTLESLVTHAMESYDYGDFLDMMQTARQIRWKSQSLVDAYGGWEIAMHDSGSPVTGKKTPDAWLLTDEFAGITVIDPDGWNRADPDGLEGWNTPLTRDDFTRRLMRSTIGPAIS